MNTGKELIDQITFCKQLMDRLYLDVIKEIQERNITAKDTFYCISNGSRYMHDSIRLRRELNTLNNIMTYKGE